MAQYRLELHLENNINEVGLPLNKQSNTFHFSHDIFNLISTLTSTESLFIYNVSFIPISISLANLYVCMLASAHGIYRRQYF